MLLKYYTLSGIEKNIELYNDCHIIDFKKKIIENEMLNNNIDIKILDNNIIKNDFDQIENTSYIIIYIDKLKDIKDEIRKKDKTHITFKQLLSIISIIDIELLNDLKTNIKYILIHKIFYNYKHFNDFICINVVKTHNLSNIKQIENLGYKFNKIKKINKMAVYNPDFNVFLYFTEIKNYKLDMELYYYAIVVNNINIIKYLINHNFYYDISVYCVAIQYNKLHLIKYFDRLHLISKPFDFGLIMCNLSIRYKYIKCLKYFYKMGYTWKNKDNFEMSYTDALKYTELIRFINNDFTKKQLLDHEYLYNLCEKYIKIFDPEYY